MNNASLKEAYGWLTWGLTLLISFGLLLLIAVAIAAEYKFTTPYLPVVAVDRLAWLAGAWWLYRGLKLA